MTAKNTSNIFFSNSNLFYRYIYFSLLWFWAKMSWSTVFTGFYLRICLTFYWVCLPLGCCFIQVSHRTFRANGGFLVKTSMIYIWFYASTEKGRITAIIGNCQWSFLWSTAMQSTVIYIMHYHLVRQLSSNEDIKSQETTLHTQSGRSLLVLVTGIHTMRFGQLASPRHLAAQDYFLFPVVYDMRLKQW